MLKTVIAVETDLASRIAIRYACLLGKSVDLNINTIHVLHPEEQRNSVGTGWVRQTWEDAVSRRSMNQVIRLVKSEQASCRIFGNPLFLTGEEERDKQIESQLRAGGYDLFIEGILHGFEPDLFLEKIESRLYQDPLCPVLMVKNLIDLSKGVLFVSEQEIPERAVKTFSRMFPMPTPDPEVLICSFNDGTSPPEQNDNSDRLPNPESVRSLLESEGRAIKNIRILEGSPAVLSSHVRDYSLVVSPFPRENSRMAELLSKSPCSTLFL